MSSSIWMQCAGASEQHLLRCAPWRVVESQHEVSTRKLVDSSAEQELLEALVERVKPPSRVGTRLHYLLFTPFRYPPLRHGSRFGSRSERGIWYGAEEQRTAFAEVAYYRLLFLEGTHADLGVIATTLTAFTVRMYSTRAIDLVASPFLEHERVISSPVSYLASQALGRDMREAGVELVRFRSARDTAGGTNIAAFSPVVFHAAAPRQFQQWYCTATRALVECTHRGATRARERSEHVSFDREQFLVDDALPAPGMQ